MYVNLCIYFIVITNITIDREIQYRARDTHTMTAS